MFRYIQDLFSSKPNETPNETNETPNETNETPNETNETPNETNETSIIKLHIGEELLIDLKGRVIGNYSNENMDQLIETLEKELKNIPQHQKKLMHVDVSNNLFGYSKSNQEQSIKHLNRLLKFFTTKKIGIQSFDLSNNFIDSSMLPQINLRESFIVHLDLSKNQIDDLAIETFLKQLKNKNCFLSNNLFGKNHLLISGYKPDDKLQKPGGHKFGDNKKEICEIFGITEQEYIRDQENVNNRNKKTN